MNNLIKLESFTLENQLTIHEIGVKQWYAYHTQVKWECWYDLNTGILRVLDTITNAVEFVGASKVTSVRKESAVVAAALQVSEPLTVASPVTIAPSERIAPSIAPIAPMKGQVEEPPKPILVARPTRPRKS